MNELIQMYYYTPCEQCIEQCTGHTTPIKQNKAQQSLTGWICPVCKSGMSPYTTTCPCMPNIPPTMSSDGSNLL